MEILLFSLAALMMLLASHSFVGYPLSLMLLSRLRGAAGDPTSARSPDTGRIAMLMCAYNEESVIAEKLENLLALRAGDPGLQILVYVDCASDRTAEIARRYADRITLHVSAERHGKTYGMNLLVGMADADLLVFTDANVMLAPDALQRLREHFGDPSVGCVCGTPKTTNDEASAAASSGSAYMKLDLLTKRLESQLGSAMGAHGALFAIRRALHRPPPDHIIDDMYVSFMVMIQGARVIQADDVIAYEETVPSMSQEFRRKVRIACQAFNVHRLIWPQLRAMDALTLYMYVSHKLLRWFVIYLVVAACLLFEAGLVAAGALQAAALLMFAGILVLALAFRDGAGPLGKLAGILSAFAATGLGVWRSLRGDLYQTWTPASSIRQR